MDRERADHLAKNAFIVRERVDKGDENDNIRRVRMERALKEMVEHKGTTRLNRILNHHHSSTFANANRFLQQVCTQIIHA